jgi:SAM-dependent methyltransferase
MSSAIERMVATLSAGAGQVSRDWHAGGVPADKATKGMRDFWDARARENAAWYVDTSLSYDEPDMQRFFETGAVVVAEALDGAPAGSAGRHLALEIGSGLGRICKALGSRFDEVIGFDISPTMVERARELVGSGHISFVLSDGKSLTGVGDGTADLVLSFTVFQHIPSVPVIEGYLREAGRVLRPGGLLVFQWNNEPGARRWRLRRGWLAFLQRTRIHREQYLRHAPQFLGSRVPVDRIERALDAAGIDLVSTKGTGTLYAWAWARRR